MMIHELQHKTALENHWQQLKEWIIKRWPENKDNKAQNLKSYWTIQDDMTGIGGVILKDRHIVIPDTLQKQALELFHINHIGIEKTKFLCVNQYIGQVLIAIMKNISKMFYMSWIPANTTKGMNNVP